MKTLMTTLGPYTADQLGIILPHEHIFASLVGGETRALEVSAGDVVPRLVPAMARARAAGITALAEATAVGGGRRADILSAASAAAGFPLLLATGVFKEPWVSAWGSSRSVEQLADWMLSELQEGIGDSGVRAGWIKLSAHDDELSPAEITLLRAAARAGQATGSAIGVHTLRGQVARVEANILESAGYSVDRLIWVHAQEEPDLTMILDLASRGAWIEYDAIGHHPPTAEYVRRILTLRDAGLAGRLLLSHDCSGYDPNLPHGGEPAAYTYLVEVFLPALRAAGLDEATIRQIAQTNPFEAYAR